VRSVSVRLVGAHLKVSAQSLCPLRLCGVDCGDR